MILLIKKNHCVWFEKIWKTIPEKNGIEPVPATVEHWNDFFRTASQTRTMMHGATLAASIPPVTLPKGF
jgi:hypothetical protein